MLFMTRTHIRYLCSFCAVLNGCSAWQYLRGFYRRLYNEGWVFDLLFGAECCFNLIWDVILFKALRRRMNPTWADHDPDKIVRTLLWFLRATTAAAFFCYGAAVCQMLVSVKYVDFDQLRKDTDDNSTSISSLKASFLAQGGAFYTITVLAKVAALYGIYCYYRRYKDNGDSLDESEAIIADAKSEQQPSSASVQSSDGGSGAEIPTSAARATMTSNTSGSTRTEAPHSSH